MILLCFGLFLTAVIGCLVCGYGLVWALLFGLALFFCLGLQKGFPVRDLLAMAWSKGRDSLIVVPVFLIIGMVMDAFLSDKGAEYAKAVGMPEGHRFSIAIALGNNTVTKEAHPIEDGKVTIVK